MPTSDTKAKQSYERYKSSLKDQPREDTGMLDQLLDKLYDNTIGMTGRWRNIPERNTATTRQSDKYPGNVATGSWEKSMTKPSGNNGYAEGGAVKRDKKVAKKKKYNVGGTVKGTDKMAYAGGGMANDKKRAPKTSKRPVASNKRGQRGR